MDWYKGDHPETIVSAPGTDTSTGKEFEQGYTIVALVRWTAISSLQGQGSRTVEVEVEVETV